MSVAVMVLAYNEHRFIRACIAQFPDWIDRITVLVSEYPWNGTRSEEAHKTWDILKNIDNHRLECVKLNWRTEQDQRNWGLGRLSNFDWVLVVDADEFYTNEDWETIRLVLPEVHLGCQTIVADKMTTYWKDINHRWEPRDSHKPVIAVRPMRNVFSDKRSVTDDMRFDANVNLHHLSWVKSDKEIKQKIENWGHANDFDKEAWYSNTWLKWDEKMVGIRPYASSYEQETKAILDPIPQELRELLKSKETG